MQLITIYPVVGDGLTHILVYYLKSNYVEIDLSVLLSISNFAFEYTQVHLATSFIFAARCIG